MPWKIALIFQIKVMASVKNFDANILQFRYTFTLSTTITVVLFFFLSLPQLKFQLKFCVFIFNILNIPEHIHNMHSLYTSL